VLKGKLLLPLLGALLLVGCQTSPPKPEAQVVEKPRPVQRSLEQRWQDSANRKQELESLISRLQGAELRKHARKGAASPATLEKTLARLEQARRYTRQARDIVSALYGYRKAGVLLSRPAGSRHCGSDWVPPAKARTPPRRK